MFGTFLKSPSKDKRQPKNGELTQRMDEIDQLKSLKPDDDLPALLLITEQVTALGLEGPRKFYFDELEDDFEDLLNGVVTRRALRFVLRTLEAKYKREKRTDENED